MITLDTLKERPLSYSSIKEFAKSPVHYINYLNKPRKQTAELTFGSALHCLLLEPNEFSNRYSISRKFDLRKTADKAEYETLLADAESTGKTILQQDLYDEVSQLAHHVNSNQSFVELMFHAEVEQKDNVELFGLPFVRIKDIQSGGYTIDIKTVQDASLQALNKDFFNYQYYIQAAVYGGDFAFYVVEKNPPFYNGLMEVSKEWLEYGQAKLEKLCLAFNHCLENPDSFSKSYDFWYEYENKKPIISLPSWVK
jgi:exodeoxyribonuclease VIII